VQPEGAGAERGRTLLAAGGGGATCAHSLLASQQARSARNDAKSAVRRVRVCLRVRSRRTRERALCNLQPLAAAGERSARRRTATTRARPTLRKFRWLAATRDSRIRRRRQREREKDTTERMRERATHNKRTANKTRFSSIYFYSSSSPVSIVEFLSFLFCSTQENDHRRQTQFVADESSGPPPNGDKKHRRRPSRAVVVAVPPPPNSSRLIMTHASAP
jgi:hypothetical protein